MANGDGQTFDVEINTGFRARVDFDFLRPDGKPGRTDGSPTVESDNDSIGAVKMDGERAFFLRGINAGTGQATIEADVDVGEGVENIQRVLTYRVTDQRADHISVTVGAQETDPDNADVTTTDGGTAAPAG